MISRIRDGSGVWNFYNAENIEDGFIVFTGVDSVSFEPNGIIPNDEIEFTNIESIKGTKQKFLFEISIASCNKQGDYRTGSIRIVAEGLHLQDPTKPNIEITE